jgi:hypothetical protein
MVEVERSDGKGVFTAFRTAFWVFVSVAAILTSWKKRMAGQ